MRNSNSPNKELNKHIQELHALKTEDVNPLYLYLMHTLYDKNTKELVKIFKLLSDFLIRYRIVTPSGGGGALRSVIQKYLNCIGNLGIMSQSYNSSNSNKSWPDKLQFINQK